MLIKTHGELQREYSSASNCRDENSIINLRMCLSRFKIFKCYIAGTKIIFRIYGGVCGVVALLFTAINFYSLKEGKFTSDLGEEIDPRNVSRTGY